MEYIPRPFVVMSAIVVSVFCVVTDFVVARELTLEEAVETALRNNLTIRQKELELSQTELTYRRSWNRFLPSLKASGTLSRSNKTPSVGGMMIPVDPTDPEGEPENEQLYDYFLYLDGSGTEISPSALSLSFQGSLALNAGMFMAPEANRQQMETGRLAVESSRGKVTRDVRKGYYNLLLMRENILLMEESLATAESRYEQTKINYENGLVSEFSMLQAQVAWENMKPALENLRVGYRIYLMQFKANLGIPQEEEIEPVGSIPDPIEIDLGKEEEFVSLLSERLDVRQLAASIDQIRYGRKTSLISSMTPSLVLSASVSPMIANAFSEDTEWVGEDNAWSDRGSLSVTLSLPVDAWIPNSSTWTKAQEMDLQIDALETTLEQTLLMAEIEIRSLLMNMRKSLDLIVALQANVELARKAYELTETAYLAGAKDFLEVENSQNELRSAQLELLREKYTYVSALLDLEYALNLDLSR
jgi:outer membrane protein, multidrug efflux system